MAGDSEIEIRQVFEAEDFGEELTPELREQEERIRAQIERRGAVARVPASATATCGARSTPSGGSRRRG